MKNWNVNKNDNNVSFIKLFIKVKLVIILTNIWSAIKSHDKTKRLKLNYNMIILR